MADITEAPGADPKPAHGYHWFARIAITLALGFVTVRMAEAADNGTIDWVSYPAFTLLVASVFIIYRLVYRWQE